MEAVNKYGLLFAFALVLLIRVPFLNQAIQGDDHIYLTEAEHALVDPLHPSDVKYVFLGDEVDLRGHSHPPGNAWPLAALILLAGDVKEIPFHAAYIIFSLIAVWAMWSLARRFSNHPLWATLLFIAVPAFVINGGSLEADLPFLALWMASVALFIGQKAPLATGRSSDPPRDTSDPSFDSDPTCASDPPRDTSYPSRDRKGAVVLSALAMALAAMMAYQAVFLIPILGAYCWIYHRRDKARWITLATPLLTLIAWQLFTRLTTGTMPAGKLAEYFDHYGFQAISHKLKSALMLAIHSGWIVFPALLPVTIVQAWRRRHEPDTRFLLAWIAIFFAGAVVLFFSGSARYLLPMAAPVCILASRTGSKWLAPAFALQLALALALA
ncbi:MAG: hypothetical protein JWP63_5466, partial [Candidatus Solibacter sp.]|nr:hypothetical protein [Candidatus Solibacter sp.]